MKLHASKYYQPFALEFVRVDTLTTQAAATPVLVLPLAKEGGPLSLARVSAPAAADWRGTLPVNQHSALALVLVLVSVLMSVSAEA
jgi:hypothetical protein